MSEIKPFEVIVKLPIFRPEQLSEFANFEHGFSIYRDLIVVWDRDHDVRILKVVDERFPIGSQRPLAVNEHKGTLSLLWNDRDDVPFEGSLDIHAEGDWWNLLHYCVENGVAVECELRKSIFL
jgi:hypothetical protein